MKHRTWTSNIQKLRRKAAKSEGRQCYYCQQPMWETDPKIFSERFRVPTRAVFLFQCTAEHLVARCDGGRDTKENIVAACLYCNKNRHRTKRPKDAASYARYVRSRMKQGRWHRIVLKQSLVEISRSQAAAINRPRCSMPDVEVPPQRSVSHGRFGGAMNW
ncbi:HNH endonuclease [Sinorhizobium fredii]|uniref:HNH endonuclease n=2 Tax=Rhizobium fredii TaxID=380 RepID=UPI0009B6CFBE